MMLTFELRIGALLAQRTTATRWLAVNERLPHAPNGDAVGARSLLSSRI